MINFKKMGVLLLSSSLIVSGCATKNQNTNSNSKKEIKTITLEEVKNILSEEKIKWREVNKSHLIGYDLDDNIGVEIIRDINTNSIIVKLEKDR